MAPKANNKTKKKLNIVRVAVPKCPNCNTFLKYSENYKRWICPKCNKSYRIVEVL